MVKLPEKQRSLFKLAVWTCLIVWMVFFVAYSIALARKAALFSGVLFQTDSTWGTVMSFVLPVWMVFTALLIVVIVARWANRKLGGK